MPASPTPPPLNCPQYVGSLIYCLYFHPLAKYPGPIWSKFSVWPYYYYTVRGDRHIWIWQCHEIYGPVFRYRPDGLLFNSPQANRDIYEGNHNVKKRNFYQMYPRKAGGGNTWNCVDKVRHARKRRTLNAAFSDKALKTSEGYIVRHVDRWCELIGADNGWSKPRNMADWYRTRINDLYVPAGSLNRLDEVLAASRDIQLRGYLGYLGLAQSQPERML
ncbi:MAG: hypothetical protein Q9188_003724 [Gyalolechia gomerana]